MVPVQIPARCQCQVCEYHDMRIAQANASSLYSRVSVVLRRQNVRMHRYTVLDTFLAAVRLHDKQKLAVQRLQRQA